MTSMKKRSSAYEVYFIITLFMLLLIRAPMIAKANSWTEDADKSIYEKSYTDDQRAAVNAELDGLDDKYSGVAGDVMDSLFGKFLTTAGDNLYKIIASVGFDLNAIIYGRVGGSAFMTDNISIFTYELTPGNIYGLVSMVIYAFLRSVISLIMICVLLFQWVTFLYTKGNARERDQLKSNTLTFIIMLLSMILFPKVLDLILYIRDCILYGVMVTGSEIIDSVGSSFNSTWSSAGEGTNIAFDFFSTGSSYSLVGIFRTIVEHDMGFVNAAIYDGAVAIQVYFGISYVGAAFALLVLVIIFPFCALLEMFDHTSIKSWIKQVLGIILNPIIDSCLLLVPMLLMLMGNETDKVGYYAIALIACSCIIPARGTIRVFLGVGNGLGFELAGLGAVLGVMKLANTVGRGAVGLASRLRDGISSSKQDEEMADLYSEQARRKDLESINEQQALQGDMESIFGEDNVIHPGNASFNPISEAEMENMSFEESANARQENLKNGMDAMNIRKEQLADEVRQGEIESNRLGTEMAGIDQHTADLRAERAMIDPKESEAAAASVREIDQRIAENNTDRQQLATQQKQIQLANSQRKDQIGKINALGDRVRSAQGNMRGGGIGGRGGGISSADQEVLNNYANIDNFEMPQFQNISMERKAELYRARARRTRMRTAAGVAGSAAGSFALGSLAFAGTTFGSTTTTAYATAMGIGAGNVIGGVAGDMAGAGASTMSIPRPNINPPRNSGGVPQADQVIVPRQGEARISHQQPAGYLGPPPTYQNINRGGGTMPPPVDQGYYSDSDRHGTPYERRPTSYEPDWIFGEEGEREKWERQRQYGSLYDCIFTDSDRKVSVADDMKRSMREVSAVARQSFYAMREGNPPRTETDRRAYNQRIIEGALEMYGRSVVDKAVLPDMDASQGALDYEEFTNYAEERFKMSSRNQMERYLRSKGILF